MASDIKTSHLCCLYAALVFDTTSPSAEPANTMLAHRAISLNHGWLHRVMGISPPAGSLSAALLACVWDWTEVSLSLMESLRYSLPQAVFWTDGPAWHLIWPSLIGNYAVEPSNSYSIQCFLRVNLQQHLQVVLAHSPMSLAPVTRPHQESIQTIRYSAFKVHEGEINLPPHY